MYSQAEIETKIRAIDAKIDSGVKTVTVDGTTTTVDLVELRRRRTELERQLHAYRSRKPSSARIDLGGF